MSRGGNPPDHVPSDPKSRRAPAARRPGRARGSGLWDFIGADDRAVVATRYAELRALCPDLAPAQEEGGFLTFAGHNGRYVLKPRLEQAAPLNIELGCAAIVLDGRRNSPSLRNSPSRGRNSPSQGRG